MSYTLRTRRVAYDNIAVGSATGREYPAVGLAGSTERYAGGSNVITADGATSAPEASTEPTTNFARNRIITEAAGVTSLDPRETIINTN